MGKAKVTKILIDWVWTRKCVYFTFKRGSQKYYSNIVSDDNNLLGGMDSRPPSKVLQEGDWNSRDNKNQSNNYTRSPAQPT